MIDRRQMIKSAVATSATALAVHTSLSAQSVSAAANERIRLGVIGIGPRCRYVLGGMLKHADVQCVAIADVQSARRDEGKQLVDSMAGHNNCETHIDFREILDRKDIDAVLIATGDRWHANASMLAAEAGKDIYSEKPCGITIDLCRRLSETIKTTGRVFQAGTQRRTVTNFQQAVGMVHDGKLGKLQSMHATVYVPEIKTEWLPGQPTPDPRQCDWNLWLGPAPWRPYNETYVNGGWRGYHDFDSGARLLDWGAHTVDLCQWAKQADDTMPVEYTADDKGITCKYADGTPLRIHFLKTPFGERPGWVQSLGTCPVRFEGTAGSVEVGDSGGIVTKPESLASGLAPLPDKERGLDVEAHSRNWLDCIKSRELPNANHNVMRRSHTACHAAALSWILGRTLRLDPKTELFAGDDEANRLRERPQRNWS
ncbi:Gfo/Idh/MocA family protein [Rhodopirellula sp. MGV]|uniref:Gfo/Idh/MocA family protein n=1 Tax=Rhodopirellula sp. MGV TaxID=2023130 RepID=UPI000B97299E|nr:Gfo/Idh/MocA family oxidoreductase [Rhodopirellula sp. MGV]OYP32335.1 dehydrogenase [Rhodopirellula sp. MGV]PNY35882.1 gfo/Idh/MocA family oxidoreductase [Rhodopirellula baltica]